MLKEEFISNIKSEFVSVSTSNNNDKIDIKNGINKETLLSLLSTIYDYENDSKETVLLNLKDLNAELLIEAFRYSLTREDLNDPLMLLNIFNLIKTYNTLDDSFFENENIYISSIENLLDIKLELKKELSDFQKKLSVYFISLFKSCNKITYEPLDKHIALPKIFENIILSSDILTLSGIFAVSESFSTEECTYIENANQYLMELLMKGAISSKLMSIFLGDK